MRFRLSILVLILLACSCRKEHASESAKSDSTEAAPHRLDPLVESVAPDFAKLIHVSEGAAPGYVGQQACYSCHADIYKSYQETGMAKSFFRPSVDNVIEDFDDAHFFHERSDRHYRMTLEDGKFFITRYQEDAAGQRINVWRQEITWVIGSGHHSRGYLYQTASGELFQMPVAWYAQASSWGMAPGYDFPGHDDFSRPITRSCMFCHNAYPEVPEGSDAYGQPDLFPHVLPEGTGCERCHGPGAAHVTVATDLDASSAAIRESIVNPGRLSPALANDVCMQCHLQPTSKLTSFTRVFGRADYSYLPGTRLADYMVHFDFETNEDDAERFEIDSAAYRMRQSVCFEKSAGALTCITCHDPHEKVPTAEAADYFRERCFACHAVDACSVEKMVEASGHASDGDCIACHMPKRRTDDVVHVVMTDHKIVRHRPERDLLAELDETLSPTVERTSFYGPSREPEAVYLAISEVRDGVEGAAAKLVAALSGARVTALEPYVELASAALSAGDVVMASEALGSVGASSTGLPLYHALVGGVKGAMGDWSGAKDAYEEAIELSPVYATARFNHAMAAMRLGLADDAEAGLQETVRLRPAHAKAHFNLGMVHIRAGRMDAAGSAFERAAAVDPDYVSAYFNWGLVASQKGDEATAVRVWRHGLGRGEAHRKMALKLATLLLTADKVSLREPREALHWSAAVAGMGGDDRDVRAVLGAALLLNDRAADALKVVGGRGGVGDGAGVVLVRALAMKQLGIDGAETMFDAVAVDDGDALGVMLKERGRRLFSAGG